ncbi:MAG TPA: alpha-ketoglutarate-dependent dioxygenase AlkB [Actinomycetota bacterium]|nr:alpha-ketoglutarate-dependent dioxygenase AlkB [Actinomycetota bacterium]
MPRSPSLKAEPAGLLYRPDFLSPDEHGLLTAWVEGLTYEPVVMHGQTAKRQVRHFGFLYGYESWSLTPGESIPEELFDLRSRCATLADLEPDQLDEALVTRYPPGAGIGWHRDAPMFGPKVIGVSLLSESKMRFQRRVSEIRQVFELVLDAGSAYVLQGEVRTSWQHSIPAVKSLRYSITFRTVKNPARWAALPAG